MPSCGLTYKAIKGTYHTNNKLPQSTVVGRPHDDIVVINAWHTCRILKLYNRRVQIGARGADQLRYARRVITEFIVEHANVGHDGFDFEVAALFAVAC